MQEDKSATKNHDSTKSAPVPQSMDMSISSVALWRRIAFWSIFPAVFIVPAWFAFGRGFLGAGGWGIFITLFGAVVIILPYQLIIMTLALIGKREYLSRWASSLLSTYYALIITTQISFVDGGDTQESIGSALTFIGVPKAVNGFIFVWSCIFGVAAMVALIIVLIIDIIRNRQQTKLIDQSAQ